MTELAIRPEQTAEPAGDLRTQIIGNVAVSGAPQTESIGMASNHDDTEMAIALRPVMVLARADADPHPALDSLREPTRVYYTGGILRAALPPAADDGAGHHDLQQEAKTAAAIKEAHHSDLLLPPTLSFEDSMVVDSAMQNKQVSGLMIEKYGAEAFAGAWNKSKAIAAVNSGKAIPVDGVYRQYSRIRRGLPQDDTIPPLELDTDGGSDTIDALSEPPLADVPHKEPLIYTEKESAIILDTLRAAYDSPMAAQATSKKYYKYPAHLRHLDRRDVTTDNTVYRGEREGDRLAIASVLERYSPDPEERAKYRQILIDGGANLDVGNVPHYDNLA